MEKLPANMKSVSAGLSKLPDAHWNAVVVEMLTKCALHFRQELHEVDLEIYLSGLREFSADRIKGALELCFRECEFMPKLKDILERMPEEHYENEKPDLKIVREWDEDFTPTAKLHFIEYENGYRQSRIVRK
jgi:hypothetical protein